MQTSDLSGLKSLQSFSVATGPLDYYDLSEDQLPETNIATLRIILQLLKACGAAGLDRRMMRKIYKEEKLKHKPKMLSRICEIAVYNKHIEKFYYKKYKSLSHCECFDLKMFKKLMKKKKIVEAPKMIFIVLL